MPFDALALIRSESAALAAASAGNLAAPVEHCPGWTVSDLVWHVYNVQAFWGQIVERQLRDPAEVVRPNDVPDEDLLEVFNRNAARFVDVLEAADSHSEVWTWSSQHDVAFVIRHQVQEAAVHRWDAEHARGRASALPPDAAADAVAEFLQHSLGPGVDTADRLTGAVELRATDTAARWRLSPQPNGPPVIRSTPNDDGSAAATVSAPAFDLLLLLYRRLTADSVHVDGDHTQVAALAGHTATD